MKANTHPLPSKLSDLILVALEDLERAERSKRYDVFMLDWHEPLGDANQPRCSVCFAGSVIAFGLGGNIDTYLTPDDFPEHEEKLSALNAVRCGYVHTVGHFEVSDYDINPERWKTEMVLTAWALKEAGL